MNDYVKMNDYMESAHDARTLQWGCRLREVRREAEEVVGAGRSATLARL